MVQVGEFTVRTSVETQQGGFHVAAPYKYLENVILSGFAGRTKTTYNQNLFKMPGGCVRKAWK